MNKALQSGGISKNKEVGAVMVAQDPKYPLTYQILLTHISTLAIQLPIVLPPPTIPKTLNLHITISPPPARQNYPKPRPNFDRRPPRQYTPISEPIAQMYERLKVTGYVTPIPVVVVKNLSQWINPNKTCAYHSGVKGHTIEECRTLKDKIRC
uniref:Uncharacterized protein n=1 Tax=Nicotiana tabacum TaxID=4097 RepID=Q9XH33_TOBAC|nr:hypothetical protein [Nicotiana tabacum]